MVSCAKNYVVKPPLIDVKCQFSYFTHNNWPKLKLKRPYGIKVGLFIIVSCQKYRFTYILTIMENPSHPIVIWLPKGALPYNGGTGEYNRKRIIGSLTYSVLPIKR